MLHGSLPDLSTQLLIFLLINFDKILENFINDTECLIADVEQRRKERNEIPESVTS